jgi:hypothetical protein
MGWVGAGLANVASMKSNTWLSKPAPTDASSHPYNALLHSPDRKSNYHLWAIWVCAIDTAIVEAIAVIV